MAGMPMPMPMMGAFPPMVFDQSMLPGALLVMCNGPKTVRWILSMMAVSCQGHAGLGGL